MSKHKKRFFFTFFQNMVFLDCRQTKLPTIRYQLWGGDYRNGKYESRFLLFYI